VTPVASAGFASDEAAAAGAGASSFTSATVVLSSSDIFGCGDAAHNKKANASGPPRWLQQMCRVAFGRVDMGN
jgi:hypothetical protein